MKFFPRSQRLWPQGTRQHRELFLLRFLSRSLSCVICRSALTWTLYALSQNPDCQSRLRVEIAAVATPTPSPEVLNELPYLDMVVRESLRLYSPVSQTMRVATMDDIIPVAMPYRDAKGRVREDIM